MGEGVKEKGKEMNVNEQGRKITNVSSSNSQIKRELE